MSLTCKQIQTMARGEIQALDLDWGDNTAGEETGALKDGDAVATCTVSVVDKPLNSVDPTLGSVSVPVDPLYVNGRLCLDGQYTTCLVTTAANQDYGRYILKFIATTDNGFVLPRFARVDVGED